MFCETIFFFWAYIIEFFLKESINEVDNQLIESAKEEEKELRDSLDVAESRIRDVSFIILEFIFSTNKVCK
jgi:hypothetical protein